MIYTILISIVFIAELIITISIFRTLLKIDKYVISLNSDIAKNKSPINDISILVNKISAQGVILVEDFVGKTKEKSEDILLRQIFKFLLALIVLSFNFRIIKKIRKSKITKTLVKGFSFLENMV